MKVVIWTDCGCARWNSSLPAAGLAAALLESHSSWPSFVPSVYLCFTCGRRQEVSEEKHAISKLGLWRISLLIKRGN